MRKGRKGYLKTLITGIVIGKGRVHGYEIYRELVRISGEHWKPSIGTIYRLLGEMVEEGCLSKEETVIGHRRIIYYTPTEKGINEFLRISREFLDRVKIGLNLIAEALNRVDADKYHDVFKEIRYKLIEIRSFLSKVSPETDTGEKAIHNNEQ